MTAGVIYIAMGDEFVGEARCSARSLHDAMGDVSASIITDERRDLPEFEEEIIADNPHYGFRDKVEYMDESPYEKTLYLDTDIYVQEDVGDLFHLLEEFDIAAAHNGAGGKDCRETHPISELPDSFPEYNTGVLVFNTDKMAEFAPRWRDEYKDYHPGDQPSFRLALYYSDLRLATVPPEYNCLFREPGYVIGPVKIFHGRIKDIESQGAGKYYDVKKAIGAINQTTKNRIFMPKATGGFNVYSADSLAKRARLSVLQYGVRGTVRRAIEKFT